MIVDASSLFDLTASDQDTVGKETEPLERGECN
jgi:hypothetical protein